MRRDKEIGRFSCNNIQIQIQRFYYIYFFLFGSLDPFSIIPLPSFIPSLLHQSDHTYLS